VDADGVHQSTAENVAHEGARTAVGRFSDETEADEDVQKIKPQLGQVCACVTWDRGVVFYTR